MSTSWPDSPVVAETNDRERSSDRLRTTMTAVRLSFVWFGVRKTLSLEQRAVAAHAFDAERDFLSAGKKLIDTRHPKFKAVSSIRSQAIAFWRGISLPYPEPGIRLVKQTDLEQIEQTLQAYRRELIDAVGQLNADFPEIRRLARERLGELYNETDYPVSLVGEFEINWEYPSVEPPNYLSELSPEIYRQQCERVQARFDEAVTLAEQAFIEELARLVSHLTERLGGNEDGRPKVFRDSAIDNLNDFFERFRHLNVGSCEELDRLVLRAQQVIGRVAPEAIRSNQSLRQQLATQLAGVQSTLDGLMVDRPRRNLIRRSSTQMAPNDSVN